MTLHNEVERERALEKIKKCFKLGKSSEPHEAAAAIRQAQKLMEKFSIGEDEIDDLIFRSVLIVTPYASFKKKSPRHLVAVAQTIKLAFGVEAAFESVWINGRLRQAIRYFGANGKEMMAEYTHRVMFNSMTKAYNAYRKQLFLDFPSGARESFLLGWVMKVRHTIIEFADPMEEKHAKQARNKFYGNADLPNAKVSEREIHDSYALAGIRAADGFSIHRPMGGQTQKSIGKD